MFQDKKIQELKNMLGSDHIVSDLVEEIIMDGDIARSSLEKFQTLLSNEKQQLWECFTPKVQSKFAKILGPDTWKKTYSKLIGNSKGFQIITISTWSHKLSL